MSIEHPYVLTAARSDEEAVALALARDEELESGAVLPLSHGALKGRLRQ